MNYMSNILTNAYGESNTLTRTFNIDPRKTQEHLGNHEWYLTSRNATIVRLLKLLHLIPMVQYNYISYERGNHTI